jgi:ferrous iron transport protein A
MHIYFLHIHIKGETCMNSMEMPLDRLPVGRKANVVSLKSNGTDRRRMLDLGIIRGTEIEPLYKSPSGNPVAYWIRGAVIALRTDVSSKILVKV